MSLRSPVAAHRRGEKRGKKGGGVKKKELPLAYLSRRAVTRRGKERKGIKGGMK